MSNLPMNLLYHRFILNSTTATNMSGLTIGFSMTKRFGMISVLACIAMGVIYGLFTFQGGDTRSMFLP